MRPLVFALAAVAAALGFAACDGGGGANEPLALDERVPSEQDAPDSKPDPVEKRVIVKGPDEFIAKLGDRFINPTPADVRALRNGGFVQAIDDARFIPAEAGGPHTQSGPHVFSLVLEFESADEAQEALEIVHADSIRPCPETCATQVSEFDVADISGSYGVRRYATAASVEATGDEGRPYDSYEIGFADGPFAYRITLDGPPGEVTEEEAEDIARRLYDRVEGAPVKD